MHDLIGAVLEGMDIAAPAGWRQWLIWSGNVVLLFIAWVAIWPK